MDARERVGELLTEDAGLSRVERWTYELDSPFLPPAVIAELVEQEAYGDTAAREAESWEADLEDRDQREEPAPELLDEVDRRSRAYAAWVQQALNRVTLAGLTVDGGPGPRTQVAVRRFQISRGLAADGVVGARTEAALIASGAPAPPGAGTGRAPSGPRPAPRPAQGPVTASPIPIPVPPPCLEVPPLPGADRPCAGVDARDFARIPEVARFAAALADCYARRNATKEGRDPAALRAEKLTWLEAEFRDTVTGAGNRRRARPPYQLRQVARSWMFGMREWADFHTLDTGGRGLVSFRPPPAPRGGDRLVDIEPPATSDGAKVQPVMNSLLRELRTRAPRHRASNYAGHGEGWFDGRGYSIDLWLVGGTDERGFYPRPNAVRLLLALDAAAQVAGVQWRAIYNDYAVAAAVNRHLGRKRVIFVGKPRRGGQRIGLNWHGPLLLHVHVDIVPLAPGGQREDEHEDLYEPSAESFSVLELEDPAALRPDGDAAGELDETWDELSGEDDSEASYENMIADEAEDERGSEFDSEGANDREGADEGEYEDAYEDEGAAAYDGEDENAYQDADADATDGELGSLLEHEDEWGEAFEHEGPSGAAIGALDRLLEAEAGVGTSLADRVRGVAAFALGPELRRGSRGPAVAALQRTLVAHGHDLAVDGDFGPNTDRAVRAAQSRLGRPITGVVDATTKAAIAGALAGGSLGPRPRGPAAVPGPSGPATTLRERVLRVMELLVGTYHYPVNAAAGLAGNLEWESNVLPNRLEGSRPESPMMAPGFDGRPRLFTSEEVRDRDIAARRGPRLPGVGLAQWTYRTRRAGLFAHEFRGRRLGADILFDLDAQVDYLVTELRSSFSRLDSALRARGISVDRAADDVLYDFERPKKIAPSGTRLPRSDPRVVHVFRERREAARRALAIYRAAHPA